jgi:hypothetical protein
VRRKLFRPREKFLILELTRKGANGLFLSVDEEKNITLEKVEKNIDLKKFLKSPVRQFSNKAWEGEHLFKSRRKLIVAATPSLATTIPIPLDLSREREAASHEIALSEIENMIAQAMGKIFNQCRAEAATRLGTHELEVILVGAKAKNFKVDGSSVMNPVGFIGKKISLLLELTFTNRKIFEDFKDFFNSPEEFFFAEAPQARLSALARRRKLPLNLIVAAKDGASLFILQKAKDEHPVLYREKIGWHSRSLVQGIAADLKVKDVAAHDLYRMYLAGKMSEGASRAMKRALDPAVEELWKEVEKGKLGGFVYVDMPHELPFPLPHKRSGLTFERFPIEELLHDLGFSVDTSKIGEREGVLARHLLPFVEAYFDRSNSEINQKLRRRLHWLLN